MTAKRRTGDQSKESILKAAGEVFAERGFEKTTIREVARRAGISIGGIYIYFSNKEELYTGLMQEQMGRFCSHLGTADGLSPVAALEHIIDCYIEFAVKRTKMLSTNIKEHDLPLKRPLKKAFFAYQKKLISGILKKGMDRGDFKKANPGETTDVVLSCLRGAMLSYLTGEIGNLRKHGNALHDIILNGIKETK